MSYDRLVEVIADIATILPADHVAAWAGALMDVDTPGDSAVAAKLVGARPGFSVGTHVERLMRSWRMEAPDLPGSAVGLALRSAALMQGRADARRTELVVSGPISAAVPVRLTSSVVIEVIRAARSRLLVASFAAYGVAEVVAELRSAALRGVQIDLILESSATDGGALRGSAGAALTFATLRHHATFWHWPATRRASSGNSHAALHAKLIAADSRVTLISSANLTDRALSHNIEVGVVLHDPEVARKLVAHFQALADPRTGVLQRLL